MKKINISLLTLLAIVLISCNKDDDPTPPPVVIDKPVPEPENQAPGAFDLLEVGDKNTDAELLPTFKWNTSTDPDGDMVGYDLLMGGDENTLETMVTGLNTATYKVSNRLSLFTEYFWNVTAKDGKGKETSSDIFSFTTRNLNQPEAPANADAQFSPRWQHTITLFKDKLWVIGGQDGNEVKIDVFNSLNGIDWTKASGKLPQARTGHSTVVFNDTLWVMGGRSFPAEFTRRNQLYGTVDGINFINGYNAPWAEREWHTSVVFKDKVWVLGGIDKDNKPLNDVWSTNEVKTWDPDSQKTADWSERFGHSTVVFDDKLWVIGGFDGTNYLNEVWYTDGSTNSDGETHWEEFVQQENSFTGRLFHQTVVYDDKIWLVGGSDDLEFRNDIWYTEDGANWIPINKDANFTGRARPALTVFDDQLLMLGGFDGNDFYNDVWVFN